MKYINQYDYPHYSYMTCTNLDDAKRKEWGKTTSVRTSGCGLCSAVMVADRLLPNCTFELKDALRIAYDTKANHKIGTDYKRFAPEFCARLGLTYETSNDPERLCDCLRTGGAAVINISGDREGHIGVFSHGGHYIAAIGLEPDGRVAVLDTSYKEGKYEEEGRKGLVEMKNEVVALCNPELLAVDAKERDPSFYLFWRK